MHFKQIAKDLSHILLKHGIKTAVVSPGSRNAPLIQSFQESGIECLSIVDERSAAFFALGIWQSRQEPIAICCTSGSALLNYAPGVAEAYYKKCPLLIISADRPESMVDQGDGQTLKQFGALQNVVKQSFKITDLATESKFANRTINQACIALTQNIKGPIHLNIHLNEPLYTPLETDETTSNFIAYRSSTQIVQQSEIAGLETAISTHKKVMILCGEFLPTEVPQKALEQLNTIDQVVILHEVGTNLNLENSIESIDKTLGKIDATIWKKELAPSLLISIGNNIVSKKIKQRLRLTAATTKHIHIGKEHQLLDTFFCLEKQIAVDASNILDALNPNTVVSNYKKSWMLKRNSAIAAHATFETNLPFTDFTSFSQIAKSIPSPYNIHWTNSSVVRYAQLFSHKEGLKHFANRGVSGIDGCTSTAVGFAFANQEKTLLISGDISFQYDINGLWNKHIPEDFKIIILNNSGGNIFRIIDGPKKVNNYQTFVETQQSRTQEYTAKHFGFEYLAAHTIAELKNTLQTFFDLETKAILEIFTPAKESADTLRSYFKYLEHE